MRKWFAAALAVVLVVAVASAFIWFRMVRQTHDWSSPSAEARQEMVEGLEDWERYYWPDAYMHFQRALELDPNFAAAKLYLAMLTIDDETQKRALLAELSAIDRTSLDDREQFLLNFWLAWENQKLTEATRIVEEFVRDFPLDAYGNVIRCDLYWDTQQLAEAEVCYRQLIDLHPKWVQAQDRLGLIAMARGRFEQAEEHFLTYRYTSPDQAVPYVSLSQLLILQGRYEEAEKALTTALEVKGDYCEAFRFLMRLYGLSGRPKQAFKILGHLEAVRSCGYLQEWGITCAGRAWVAYENGDIEGARRYLNDACRERRQGFLLLGHRLDVRDQNWQQALAAEEDVHRYLEDPDEKQVAENYLRALAEHMSALRFLAQGDLAVAEASFRKADEGLTYMGLERGIFKLYNRLHLIFSLERQGNAIEAAALRQEVAAINPRFPSAATYADLEEIAALAK